MYSLNCYKGINYRKRKIVFWESCGRCINCKRILRLLGRQVAPVLLIKLETVVIISFKLASLKLHILSNIHTPELLVTWIYNFVNHGLCVLHSFYFYFGGWVNTSFSSTLKKVFVVSVSYIVWKNGTILYSRLTFILTFKCRILISTFWITNNLYFYIR